MQVYRAGGRLVVAEGWRVWGENGKEMLMSTKFPFRVIEIL